MAPLRFGITRFPSLLRSLEQQLAPEGGLTCRFGAGRVYLVLRGVGASRWDPSLQLARALDMAAFVRERLASDSRAAIRAHANHAIVVRFEDARVEAGCEVRTHWECVVPRH